MKKHQKYIIVSVTIIIVTLSFIFLPPFISSRSQSNNMDKLSLITKGMSKSEVIELFGEPQLETGFGLDICVFGAETFTLQIGFSSDGLIYAYLINKDGSVKEKIVY